MSEKTAQDRLRDLTEMAQLIMDEVNVKEVVYSRLRSVGNDVFFEQVAAYDGTTWTFTNAKSDPHSP